MVDCVAVSGMAAHSLLTGSRLSSGWLLSGFPAYAGNDRPWPEGKADLGGIGSAGQNPPQSPFAKGGGSNKDYFSSLQTENAVSLHHHLLSFCIGCLHKLSDFFKLLVLVEGEEINFLKR